MTAVFHEKTIAKSNFDYLSMPKYSNDLINAQTSGFYMFGGANNEGKALNDLWILRLPKAKSKKTITDPHFEWERILPNGHSPKGRYGHTSAIVQGYIFIVGGRNDELFATEGVSHLNEVIVFNIQHCRWEEVQLAGSPLEGRWGACAEVIGSKLILYGGMELANYCSGDLCYMETNQYVVADLLLGQDNTLRYQQAIQRRDVVQRNIKDLMAKPSIKQLFRKMF